MNRDEVRLSEDLVERAGLDAHARDVFGGDEWIEADHFHSQARRPLGDDAADIAKADDADGFVAHLDADEFIAVPLAAFERGDGLRDMARQSHHESDGMLAGGDVVAAGSVHDDDAFFRRRIGVDVFITDAGAANHF